MAASMRLKRAAQLGNIILRNEYRLFRPAGHRAFTLHCQHKDVLRGASALARGVADAQRFYSSQVAEEPKEEASARPRASAKDTERAIGESDTMEFQAETRMLLDIVAKSLYSDKEVFVRELISNASDALEKLRYLRLSSAGAESKERTEDAETEEAALLDAEAAQRPLEIRISTDKQQRTLTIQDNGVGMSREELMNNLGTIARSGSKAFVEQLKDSDIDHSATDASSIIGQFGVGFYSAFMVGENVEVFTRSSSPNSQGYCWSSDGSGTYEIQDAEGVKAGTKIVIHLKTDCREFSDDNTISNVIKKYSNFVGSPIFLNDKQVNTIQPLWLMDPKEVTPQMHDEFYRFVGNAYDRPRFTLHYKTDAPLTIRSLLYFPEGKPGLFELSRETDMGVALYSRKVLIKSKADNVLPKWLRFVKGVVDSEDIPLNLSRELLQNSALIRKLQTVLTNRILRFLHDKSVKETEEYDKFYKDYGLFLKEGIVSTHEQLNKEEIGKLLRFESSQTAPGEKVSLPQYSNRLKQGQRDIFYLAAPSRQLAEASPYFEALRKRDVEVLFCYEPYDELVLMQLRQFNQFSLISVEKEMRQGKDVEDLSSAGPGALSTMEVESLLPWIKQVLQGKVFSTKVTNRLEAHPCVVTVEEMAAARHFVRTQSHQMPEEQRYTLLQPQLEINPKHPIIKKLNQLKSSNPKLAELVVKQIFANSMVAAGLLEDPRTLLTSMNELLTIALEKH